MKSEVEVAQLVGVPNDINQREDDRQRHIMNRTTWSHRKKTRQIFCEMVNSRISG